MTGNRYEQARALFLSALMVVSVFGATVAFAGAASADVGSFAVDASDHDTRSDNTEFGVSGTVSADGNDVTLQFTDSEDNTDTVTLTEDADSDAQFDQNVDLSSTFSESGPAEGTLTVEVDEGSSFSSAEASTTVTVDDTSPTVNSYTPSSGAEVASTTQEITVDLQEQGSGIDTNTVQVVLDDGTDEFVDLTGTGPGIQYDQSNTDIIITPGDGRVPELPEGTVNWEIQADDNAGNSLTDSDSFSVVPAIPSVTLDSSQNTLLNTRQPNNVQFDLDDSDSYADIKSVEVTARNPSSGSIVAGIDGSTDSDSFISYSDGAGTDELTVDIGDASPSKTLADGDTEFVVTGYTETGQQGDSFSSTFTIETDTDAPSINSISTSVNQPATESNTGSSNTIDLQVTFDESMDTGAAYTPDVQLTGAASSDYEIDAISNGNNGWSNSGQTWTGEFDLTDDNEEVTGTIEVTASSAVDEAGNSLSGSNSIDFDIDTLGPTVNPVSGEIEDDVSQPSSSYSDGVGDGADSTDVDEIEGSIGLDQHFTVSDADNNGLTYQIASYSDVEDNSDPFEADEQGAYTTIDADYDTRSISDGYYVITASTADDNGN